MRHSTRALATLALLALTLILLPQRLATAQSDRWVDLLDGGTLDHWVAPGDGAWAIEGTDLVVAKPGQGWWIRTKKAYRDFQLELDFKLPKGGNSGVGLRGSQHGDPAFTGFEVQVFDSYGQEPTINGCGAVYNAITPLKQAVKPAGHWNRMSIKLTGDVLTVYLNGQLIHDAAQLDERGFHRAPDQKLPLNDRLKTGYISLQDHGDAVRYRNIRILDLSRDAEPDGMKPLLTSMDDFMARGGGQWTIEPGRLIGKNGPGHIFTRQRFTDVEIRANVKVNTRGNSGLYFRTVPNAGNPDSWPTGYEAQVDNHDPKNFTGCLYDKAWPDERTKPITRDNAWFDYRIRVEGDRVRTWIDGIAMVDAQLTDFADGHIAFQTHHPGNEVEYRDVRVLRLE